jgi:5S rRNA maturation endonuclease (ribonuclease M5)
VGVAGEQEESGLMAVEIDDLEPELHGLNPLAEPTFPLLDGRPAAAVYGYQDEQAELVYAVGRYELDGDKTFRPARVVGGRWKLNLDGVRRVVYRLPAVLAHIAANSPEPLYVVDGEKDVEAIEAKGGVATCCPGGMGNWTPELAEQLKSARRVILVVDNDDNGQGPKQARKLVELLGQIAIVPELVQASEGKDAADHLAAGRTLDELVPLELPPDPDAPAAPLELRVVSVEDFAAAEVANEEPLIGSGDKRLLPSGSTIVFYGEGGSGKTTLTSDLAFHLAAGVDWLGFEITTPVKVMLLENEGPIDEYRLKIRRKLASWEAPSVDGRLFVYESPWGRADLRDTQIAELLGEQIAHLEIDVLIAGPVRRLGLEGGGTPAETVAFMQLLDRVRDLAARPLAIATVHHENKGGDISGAFEAEFDTVVHVKADGRDRTQLVFRKSRWSSKIHRSRMTLAWALDSEGFGIVETDGTPDVQALAAEDAGALEWLTEHVTAEHAKSGTGVSRGKAETAYHQAHGNRGRNLARRVIDTQIALAAAYLAAGGTGEVTHNLATGPGEVRTGIYLYPACLVPSPLAGRGCGEGGEHTPAPPQDGTPRRLAASPKGGEASGEDGPGVDPEELDRPLRDHADVAAGAPE